ncbi:MAG: HlyD family efflux transporter periplasmic adaptor subunit [Rhizobiales bacterium]|nr:HlyD family efflux transporter periplasmic adaptor subunit [Hyphomicrobiales bacterium]
MSASAAPPGGGTVRVAAVPTGGQAGQPQRVTIGAAAGAAGPGGPTPLNMPRPGAQAEDPTAGLRHLLRVEAEMRRARDLEELTILTLNEARKIARARQTLYAELAADGALRLTRVSGLPTLDRDAPVIRWLERALTDAFPPGSVGQRAARLLEARGPDEEGGAHPFRHALWLPLARRDEAPFGALVALREAEWGEADTALAERVAETAAHAAAALMASRPRAPRRRRLWIAAAAVATVAAMAIPVPMTALAPAEIVGRDAFVVAAPIEGVVERIVVAPSAMVKEGDLLAQFVDTAQRNQLEVSQREVEVAEAKLRQISQAAFFDDKARREIAQSRAELKQKVAERDFASDQFEKTKVRAPRAGIAVYADPKEWVGRPVATGQRMLELADAQSVLIRVDLPVSDAIVLKQGARTRLFLDSEPLRPIGGHVATVSHAARHIEGRGLVYRIDAALDDGVEPPRLGARGTAQISGEVAPLGFYLFRRPLAWARQKVGL